MKSRTAGEALKQFVNVVEEQGIIPKQNEVVKLISEPISNARQKLKTLESRETDGLLAEIGYPPAFLDDVRTNILDIFEEEVIKAQRLIKELDVSISVLQECIDDIIYRLGIESKSSEGNKRAYYLATDCYEHCRSIMKFLKLKNKILKHCLLAPADVLLTPDPFSQFPDYREEEENVSYLMCKIEYANFDN